MSTPETLTPDADEIVKTTDCLRGMASLQSLRNPSIAEFLRDTARLIDSLRTRLAEVEKELAGFRNAPVQEQKLCGRFGLKSYLDLENEVSHLGTSLAETRIELAQLKAATAELVKDKERLLNVLEHCALDPDKQPTEQYKVARNVTKEYRQAVDAAIAAKDKTFWQDAANKAGGTQ